MNNPIQNILSIYCDSYLALKKSLYWKVSGLYIKLCALAYAFEENYANPRNLLETVNYIKMKTGFFSPPRWTRFYSAAYLTAGKKNIETESAGAAPSS